MDNEEMSENEAKEYTDDQIEEWTREDLLNAPLLSDEEVEQLRNQKRTLTEYGKKKIRKLKAQQQAQKIVEATLEHTLRPKSGDRERVIASALLALVGECGYSDFNIDGDHGIGVVNIRDILGIIEVLEE